MDVFQWIAYFITNSTSFKPGEYPTLGTWMKTDSIMIWSNQFDNQIYYIEITPGIVHLKNNSGDEEFEFPLNKQSVIDIDIIIEEFLYPDKKQRWENHNTHETLGPWRISFPPDTMPELGYSLSNSKLNKKFIFPFSSAALAKRFVLDRDRMELAYPGSNSMIPFTVPLNDIEE